MYINVLNENQRQLLGVLSNFSDDCYLTGGTAIALQIGHRKSIDYYLFTNSEIKRNKINNIFIKNGYKVQEITFDEYDQFHCIVNNVNITYLLYPYQIIPTLNLDKHKIKMPTLLDLAAMKALALGGRNKWKDYVDLYFILKEHLSLDEIMSRGRELFQDNFNAKLFKAQLS